MNPPSAPAQGKKGGAARRHVHESITGPGKWGHGSLVHGWGVANLKGIAARAGTHSEHSRRGQDRAVLGCEPGVGTQRAVEPARTSLLPPESGTVRRKDLGLSEM